MKSLSIVALLFLLISCKREDIKSYSKLTEDGVLYNVREKTVQDKYKTLLIEYEKTKNGYWDVEFQLVDDKIVFYKTKGIGKVIKLESDSLKESSYVVVEKEVDFSDNSKGNVKIKELSLNKILPRDSIDIVLKEQKVIEFELDSLELKMIKKEYKLVTEN